MIESFLKYYKFQKRVSPHTLAAYRMDLGQFQAYLDLNFPEDKIEGATYGLIRAWLVSLMESGIEPRSINRKIATLRSFYKFLLREEVIAKDPTVKIRILKTKKKLPSFVKMSEMNAVLDNDSVEGNEFTQARDKLILELFYATGIRRAELIGLKESFVDTLDNTIKVLGKRNKERVIPINRHLSQMITAYRKVRDKELGKKDHTYFFVIENGAQCYPMLINRIVQRFLQQTSSEKKSPHVLRHSFATHLLDKGAEINAVKDLLGHSSLAATQVYTHNSMDKLKKAFDQAHPKA